MKIALLLLAALAAGAGLSLLYLKRRMDQAPDRRELEAAIDAEVHKAMKSGQFPGVVVGVYKGGRRYIKGYGTINRQTTLAPGAQTVFQIGSVSKVLTASLLQAMCDEGVVSMDATLGELLGASMPLSPSARAVTLRQLVTHASGFPSIPKALQDKVTQMAGADALLLDPYSHLGPSFVFDYLASSQGQRESGRFEYSNFGMGLLGHVLEQLAGRAYEALVKEKVLMPLGMHSTMITLAPGLAAQLAQGHTQRGLATPVWTFAALAGAGAFSSTAEDMLKFIQAAVDEDGPARQRFLQMREPQCRGDTGIGWLQATAVDRFFGNREVVWHNGMVGGYAAYLAIDEAARAGVIILTNQASSADMLGMMLTRQVRSQSWSS